ncbi:retinol dehydrogenase [Microthyrium microscopicum]|uniref:Retinol dehydrogenase n=1 Tax=Microthyrium microscopicum TaxID=703497 RepID=A0A6A6UFT7_9PEZI|nr:retinol dehydrogenase [Microthyrium microscopicum]
MAAFLAAFIKRQFFTEPPKPTTSFAGKTVIVTGSNTGLGLEACRSIVQLGAKQVIIACRNIEKGKTAATEIQQSTKCSPETLQVWQLDMSSYSSVQAFAQRASSELERVDALMLNAGVMMSTFQLAEDNESTITTNVISLFLLALLMHPKLRETAKTFSTQTHITVTGSELYEMAKFKEANVPDGQIFNALADETRKDSLSDRYNVSKLLVNLIVRQIALLSPLGSSDVIVNVVAPGFCVTRLGNDNELFEKAWVKFIVRLLARKPEVGARTLVYGASAGPETHGQYLPDCKIAPLVGLAKGEAGEKLQNRVWTELRHKLEATRPGVTTLS